MVSTNVTIAPAVTVNADHFPGALTDAQASRLQHYIKSRHVASASVIYNWLRDDPANGEQQLTTKAKAMFMYEGVPGLYPKRPMLADILGNERRADGWWLHIKPHECNLDRWIPAREVLAYVWPEFGQKARKPLKAVQS